jgi:folate-binding protein YgfZ
MTPPAQSDIATASTSSPASQLAALLQATAIFRLDHTGWIRVTGQDRVRWLNGMVTNSIQDLRPGEGNYNFLLSVQGRIQGDATIFAEPDALLMETAASQVPGLMTLLDRFIIMDDVELADVTTAQSGLLVVGPKAASLLATIGLNVDGFQPLTRQTASWNGVDVSVIHAYSPLVPKFELWTDPQNQQKLADVLQDSGAELSGTQSLEWLRILEGTPLFGTDIRDRELPQETGQTRALHFAKGCYLGQEIVERIRSRGNVHRTFIGFQFNGTLPTAGSPLDADGKQVGEVTSVAAIPLPDGETIQLGLGYVRREALDRGAALVYTGGVAVPVSLPYLTSAASGWSQASESSERA